ncbi:MAG: hypothetical protein G8345_11820, partial [Magnetococcales bacterium]|nr:hypothetical protein [Magnetococcales bacterium]
IGRGGNSGGEFDRRMRQFRMAKGMDFPEHLARFVQCITKAHHILKGNVNSMEPPLLVVGIDDVDLVPHYLREDLFQFISLTSGIPRLVVITAMDYDLAFLSMKENYLKNTFPALFSMGRIIDEVWDDKDIKGKAEGLADQFLTKYLPYEARVHIPGWTLQKRALYKPVGAKKEEPCLYRLLEKALGLVLNFNYALEGDSSNQENCENNLLPSAYLNLLPNNARLLSETYYFLKGWLEQHGDMRGKNYIRFDQLLLSELASLFIYIPYRNYYHDNDQKLTVNNYYYNNIVTTTLKSGEFISFIPIDYNMLYGNFNIDDISVTIIKDFNLQIMDYNKYEVIKILTKNNDEKYYERPTIKSGYQYGGLFDSFLNELPYRDDQILVENNNYLFINAGNKFSNASNGNLTECNAVKSIKNNDFQIKGLVDVKVITSDIQNSHLLKYNLGMVIYKFPVVFMVSLNEKELALPLPNWKEPTRFFLFISYWQRMFTKHNFTRTFDNKELSLKLSNVINEWLLGVTLSLRYDIFNTNIVNDNYLDQIFEPSSEDEFIIYQWLMKILQFLEELKECSKVVTNKNGIFDGIYGIITHNAIFIKYFNMIEKSKYWVLFSNDSDVIQDIKRAL